jgi:prepilin-type N-terminal cleavage/methylation domain-containing protein
LKEKSHVKCEEGLTLIEVLASLVILGIVFIGFMNIFPQMTVFNQKTETKLNTMNLAKQEIVEIKSIPKLSLPFSLEQLSTLDTKNTLKLIHDVEKAFKIEYVKNDYKYQVEFNKDDALCKKSALEPCENTNNIALHKVHVQIFAEDTQLSSETYGYLEISNKAAE